MAEDIEVVRRRGTAAMRSTEEAIQEADDLVRTAIKSLKAPIDEPVYDSVDTSRLSAAIEKAGTSRDVANLTLGAERDRYNDAATRERAAIADEGAAKADKARADQDRAAQEAEVYKSIIDSLGVNANDIAAVGQRLAVERPVAEAKLRRLQEMESVSLLDNPFEFLLNKIEQPNAAADYNRQADIVDALQNTLDASIVSANNAALLNSKAIPAITAAQGAAAAKAAEAESKKLVAQAEEKLAMQNVSFAQQKLANDLGMANLTKESTQLELAQAQTEFQVMIAKINAADSHANRQLRAAELLEKLEKNRGLDVLLENYDRIMGNPKGTTTRYTFEKFGEAQRVNITAIGAGSGGTDPFQAMLNVYQARPGAAFSSTRLFQFIQDKAAAIQKTPQIQNIDKANQGAAISAELKKAIDLEKTESHKLGNIFYEVSPKEMILSGVLPAESPMAKILEPYVKSELPIQTGMIVATFDQNYKNPTEAGAALSEYYKKNIALRNRSQNYSLFGIKPDTTYKIPIRGSMFGAGMTIDLTRPEDATKLILYNRMVQNMQNKIKEAGPMGKFN